MQKEFQLATGLRGKDTHFSRKKRKDIASHVSRALKKHPHRMRQLPIGDVFRSIGSGNATLIYENTGSKSKGSLAAFAHVIPGMNESGQFEDGVVEIGAVVTLAAERNGYAKRAVLTSVEKAKKLGAKKIKTLVHVENIEANGLMRKLAGEPVQTRPSNYVREVDGTKAEMNEYVLWKAEKV
jgi:RimJ/RimL family protein N-acetyltransferase